MASLQKDAALAGSHRGAGPYKARKPKAVEVAPAEVEALVEALDDELWDRTFAASQDTLSRLAAQSRAHREAGQTKKING